MKKAYRHGDVILVKIDKLPDGARMLNHKVLAEGEVTGHKHEVKNGILYEKGGTLYLKADIIDEVSHPEHGVGLIDPGVYEVRRPNEWDYIKEEMRKVMD